MTYRIASLVLMFAVQAVAAEPVSVGEVVFRESFANEKLPEGWKASFPDAVRVLEKGLFVNLPADGKAKTATLAKFLPCEPLRGTRLRVRVKIKAEKVERPPNSWNGIKAMLVLETPDGKRWPQQSNLHGDFDWKTVEFETVVPANTTSVSMALGLENTTGRAWFDDIEIVVTGKRRTRPPADRPKSGPADKGHGKGHDLDRLRGAMISPAKFGPEDLDVLAGQWKANHVRWQMTWSGFPNGPADTATVEQYDAWIEEQCRLLDTMLPELEKHGVRVCLDLHTPPGGRLPREEGSAMRLFQDKKLQDALVAVWQRLARRYKGAKPIWSYDLLNEPVEGIMPDDKELLDWRALALKTAKAIREIDPDRALVVEAAPWGGPDSLDWFEPFDPAEVPNVVYSVHMYVPHPFTHQGVHDMPMGLVYPGKIHGKEWNKDALRKALKPTIDFANDYGVQIYIGEFSAIRWAPDHSACRYLTDCIEIFEEQGWDWAYHAFREWNGWSVEHGDVKGDDNPAAQPTDRELLLREWFGKNER